MNTIWDSSLPESTEESASTLHATTALCADTELDSLCQWLLSASPSNNCVLCSFRLPIYSWGKFNSFSSLLSAVVLALTHSRECLACWGAGFLVTRQKRDWRLLIAMLGGREAVSAAKVLSSQNILSHWNILSSYP